MTKLQRGQRNLDQRMNGLYEDMGNILSRYYKIGEITEDEMKQRLGIAKNQKVIVDVDVEELLQMDVVINQ